MAFPAILGDVLGDILDPVADIVSEVVVDKDKKNEILLELEKLKDRGNERLHEQALAQTAVNKQEAASGSVFVAGWRPFVGWVCGAGLVAQVILFPFLNGVAGIDIQFDTELLLATLGGMLGIGTMRTVEKIKGVSTNDYRDTPKAPVTYAKEKKGFPKNLIPENVPWLNNSTT